VRAPGAWQISERGLVAEIVPVWAGTRDYDGRIEFRDPAQLRSPGFLRTLGRAPLVLGHPRDAQGRVVYLGASAPPEGLELDWSGGEAAIYPHAAYQVGQLGDAITWIEADGVEVPRLTATITHPRAIGYTAGLGVSPRREVSLGFFKHTIAEPGVWINPRGEEEPYDAIQIIDPLDPRVPEYLRPWCGANYLGIGFAEGESRGEYTRVGLDAQARPEQRRSPRTFFLLRQQDETGISGVGHVLDGVVWPDGQVVTKWCAGGPSELNVSENYAEWQSIHVDAHPANKSLIIFDDGEPAPVVESTSPPNDDSAASAGHNQDTEESTMTIEEALKMIEALKAENAALKAAIEESKGEMSEQDQALNLAKEEAAKAAAGVDARTKRIAELEAEVAPLRKRIRDERAAEVAKVAGLDAKTLDGVALGDLEVAAMKKRIETGLDSKPEHYADDPVYLRALYDIRAKAAPARTGEVSEGFRQAVAGTDAAPPAKPLDSNRMNALP